MSASFLPDPITRPRLTHLISIALVSTLCGVWIVASLDPAGSYPGLPEGPGLTVDEIFNVTQGAYLIEHCKLLGWLNLVPGTSLSAYRVENGYNPDHPPLGRLWLGVHHLLTWGLFPPVDPEGPFVIACARVGSATAFVLTMMLVGYFASAWYGCGAGFWTAIALALMPRVFGHAHLASLETMTNLTCTAAVLGIAGLWAGPALPTRKVAVFTGILIGLASLTKIQAVLIPIPVIVCMLWKWRTKAIVPLLIWGVTALVVFFASWPYLWFDSKNHLLEYLGRTTNRATLQVWYFGAKYPDKQVPWHYSFVYFTLTIPVLLQVFGLVGLSRTIPRRSEVPSNATRDLVILACMFFPLGLFAIPGIAVYDCERLFLTTFPLWAIFVGRGWNTFLDTVAGWSGSRVKWIVSVVTFVLAAIPTYFWNPCHICYYNELTSLVGGAEKAGLEIDYWGAGVTRGLFRQLETIPSESTIAVIPTLHQYQAADYLRQSPILRSREFRVVEYNPAKESPDYLMVFRRRADIPAEWDRIDPAETVAKTQVNGSMLAYVYDLKKGKRRTKSSPSE